MNQMDTIVPIWLFRTADSPVYTMVYSIIITLLALRTISPFLLRYYFIYVNDKRMFGRFNTAKLSTTVDDTYYDQLANQRQRNIINKT